jgi:hypothetical protein
MGGKIQKIIKYGGKIPDFKIGGVKFRFIQNRG